MSTHDKIVVAVRVRPFSNREIKLTAGSKRPGVSDIETDIILYIPFTIMQLHYLPLNHALP